MIHLWRYWRQIRHEKCAFACTKFISFRCNEIQSFFKLSSLLSHFPNWFSDRTRGKDSTNFALSRDGVVLHVNLLICQKLLRRFLWQKNEDAIAVFFVKIFDEWKRGFEFFVSIWRYFVNRYWFFFSIEIFVFSSTTKLMLFIFFFTIGIIFWAGVSVYGVWREFFKGGTSLNGYLNLVCAVHLSEPYGWVPYAIGTPNEPSWEPGTEYPLMEASALPPATPPPSPAPSHYSTLFLNPLRRSNASVKGCSTSSTNS